MRYSIFILFVAYWIVAMATPATAQTSISGQVTSTQGEVLPGANIYLQGTYDGATSDTAGHFRFVTRETGAHWLMATWLGCDTFRRQVVLDGTPLRLDIHLQEQKQELRGVVVSAGAFEATSDRRRAAVLSALDIVLTASSSADISGAVTMLPGTTRNGETGQILVRGGAAYETRTFMDGLLIQNPYNSTVGNLPARNRFSPFLFKGTLFSTGGYSAEYGQAMSSALILNTADLAPKTATGITLLSVGGGLAHTRRWERSSVSVSGQFNHLGPYFALVPQRLEWQKVPRSGVSELVFRRQTSDNGGILKAYLNVNRSAMRMLYPTAVGVEKKPLGLNADNIYGNISWREMIGRGWMLFVGTAWTHNRDRVSSDFMHESVQQSVQGRFTLSKSLSHWAKIKWGAEGLTGRFKEEYALDTLKQGQDRKERFSAGFAESEWVLSQKWAGRVGVRAEYSGLLNASNVAPRVSLAYMLGGKEQISLAFGRFYQMPEYEQMRYGVSGIQFEQATHLMLNYQIIKKGYIFRAEIYQKWYDKLLKNQSGSAVPVNEGHGYSRGLDVFFRDNHHIRNGDYWVSYSYLDTRRLWRDYPAEATPHFAMKHSFSIAYKQFLPRWNTALSISYAFNSGRPYYDPNLSVQQFMQSRTPAYHDLSLAVSYLTNVAGHFTVVYLSVQNVPGFHQVFGYRYGAAPDAQGHYTPVAVTPPARRFGVLAVIMTIGEKYKKSEVSSDDY